MKHFLSLFPAFFSSDIGERRLTRFAEKPQPNNQEASKEAKKEKPTKEPQTPETTPEEADNPNEAAANKEKRKVEEAGEKLTAQTNRLPKNVKPQPASAETAREAVKDAEKKIPETVRDDLSQKMDTAMAEFKKASEARPPDKNAQFKATLEVIAIVIEYIVRAFNGTLGDKLNKDKDKGAPGEADKASGAEAAGTAPAEGTPQAQAKKEVEAKLEGQPAKPEQTQKAAQEVQADAKKQIETNEGSIKERKASIEEKEKENKGLGEKKDVLEKKMKELPDTAADEKSRLKTEIDNLTSKIEANTKTIKEHNDAIAKLAKANEQLNAKMEAAKEIEKNMEPLKKWIPALEAMITATLGLKLGAGGIAITPDGGKFAVDLLSPEEQASALKTLNGAEKSGERGIMITHEKAAQAIADQLKGKGGAKSPEVKPGKPAAEKPGEKGAAAPGEGKEGPEVTEFKKLAEEMSKLIHDLPDTAWQANPDINEHPSVKRIRGEMNALSADSKIAVQLDDAMRTVSVIENEDDTRKYDLARDDEHEGFYLQEQKPVETQATRESKEASELEKTVQELNKLMDDAFNTNEKAKNSSPLTRLASQTDFKVQDGKIIMIVPQAAEKDLKLISERLGYKQEENGNLTRGPDRTVEKTKDGYALGLKEAFGTDDIDAIKGRLGEWKALMEDPDKTQQDRGEGSEAQQKFDDDDTKVERIDSPVDFEKSDSPELEKLVKNLPDGMKKTNLGKVVSNIELGESDGRTAIRVKQEGATSFRQIYDQLRQTGDIPDIPARRGSDGQYVMQLPKGEAGEKVKENLIAKLEWMEKRFIETEEKKPS